MITIQKSPLCSGKSASPRESPCLSSALLGLVPLEEMLFPFLVHRAFSFSLAGDTADLAFHRHKSRTEENLKACSITLTPDEIAAVNAVVAKNPAKGGRTIDGMEEKFFLWA